MTDELQGTFDQPQRTNDPQAVGPLDTPPILGSYLEMMRAHVDDGGTLSHRNGLDLLAEVERLRGVLQDVKASKMPGESRAIAIRGLGEQ